MSEGERPHGPVFVDATGRRRRGVTVIGYLGASAAAAYLAAFGITIGTTAGQLHTTGVALTPSPVTADEAVDDAGGEPVEGIDTVVEVADAQDHGSGPAQHDEPEAAGRVDAAPARPALVPLREVTPRAAASAPRPAAAPAPVAPAPVGPAPVASPRPVAQPAPPAGGTAPGGTASGGAASGGAASGGAASGGSSSGGTTTGGGTSTGGTTGGTSGGTASGGSTGGPTGGTATPGSTGSTGSTGTGSTTTPPPGATVTDPATADVLAIGA